MTPNETQVSAKDISHTISDAQLEGLYARAIHYLSQVNEQTAEKSANYLMFFRLADVFSRLTAPQQAALERAYLDACQRTGRTLETFVAGN